MRQYIFSAFFIAFFILCNISTAETVTNTATGYIDLDNTVDNIVYSFNPKIGGTATIKIIIRDKDGAIRRTVTKKYSMSDTHIYIYNNKPGEIAIFEAGDLGGQEKTTYYYKYNIMMKDWFLSKAISESMDNMEYRMYYDFQYYPGTQAIDGTVIDIKNASTETKNERALRLQQEFSSIYNEMESLYKSKKLSSSKKTFCDEKEIAEIIYNVPINNKNVENYNNLGFFMGKTTNNLQCGLYILQYIIDKVPERTPAYINIGDIYNNLGEKEHAKENYKIYVKQMKKEGNGMKIPNRILESID